MIHLFSLTCKCGFMLRVTDVPAWFGPTLWRISEKHLRRGRWHGGVRAAEDVLR